MPAAVLLYALGVASVLRGASGSGSDAAGAPATDPALTLRLPTFIATNMVLQRAPKRASLWGAAPAGAMVTVQLDPPEPARDWHGRPLAGSSVVGGKKQAGATKSWSTRTELDGNWALTIDPQPASRDHSLRFSIAANDTASYQAQTTTITNIAFGECFLCAGQSNMQLALNAVHGCKTAIADSVNYPDMRLATVAQVAKDTPYGKANAGEAQDGVGLNNNASSMAPYAWAVSGPKAFYQHYKSIYHHNTGRTEMQYCAHSAQDAFEYFSAVCYFFGQALYKQLGGKVPVGLVSIAWNGQRLESFMSTDALRDTTCGGLVPGAQLPLSHIKLLPSPHTAADSAATQATNYRARRHPTTRLTYASQIYNGMFHPMRQMQFAGIVWYQGETDAVAVGNSAVTPSEVYACSFASFITDLRRKLHGGANTTFTFVELAPTHGERPNDDRPVASIREAQRRALLLPRVGFASAIDLGDPISLLAPVHPQRGKDVLGHRLALTTNALLFHGGQALRDERERQYAGVPQWAGPVINHVAVGAALTLFFKPHSSEGLHADGTHGCKTCCRMPPFEILFRDYSTGKYGWARAGFKVDTMRHNVQVFMPFGVQHAMALRYAWETMPQCSLYNHAQLPASPFWKRLQA